MSICNQHPTLVVYKVEWCGHCQALKPELARAEAELKLRGFAHVQRRDGDETSRAVMQEDNVTGYPTLILYKPNGIKIPYHGERSASAIMDFVKGYSSPAKTASKRKPKQKPKQKPKHKPKQKPKKSRKNNTTRKS